MKMRRCGMTTNKKTLNQRTNDVEKPFKLVKSYQKMKQLK